VILFRLYATVPGPNRGEALPVSNWSLARREARRMYRLLRRAGVQPWLARHAIVTMLICGGRSPAETTTSVIKSVPPLPTVREVLDGFKTGQLPQCGWLEFEEVPL
jgi:hypothetical protein